MKYIHIIVMALSALFCLEAAAQDNSTATMRRGSRKNDKSDSNTEVSARMQQRMTTPRASDADLSWMRVIYRQLDLTKAANAPLYFPEPPLNGEENLFRTIMRLVADGKLKVYEYLDGREIFTDQYALATKDVLDRFHIEYKLAKGSTDKRPRYTIDEPDVPADEVLSYYVIERYEFDNRTNKLRTVIEAICPVLHRSDEWGMEPLKYPMFWVKFDDLRPYMSTQNIFVSDDNNLPSCTYDDFFLLGLYDGDIIKTRNLRNQSMMQLYPDADDLKRARDSIQTSLDSFERKLWVPSLEELQARREAKELAESKAQEVATDDSTAVEEPRKVRSRRPAAKSTRAKKEKVAKVKAKKAKAPKAKSASSATRSVRNRKR
ncbi:MAG: gliding motility protein GldN [Firmicutes bacterium]|nr:gliding motility protein GldN [Bacillota bacterium]MCM1401005.1 gliding motility protein GldN [Bacteroides sp.]MCM1476532.1 gliding motility protein GldN [Bacteroides sp.]